jgi:hypothetical protein
MITLHKENIHEKINKLEQIEFLKAAASQNILNDVINGRNDPLYKILISVDNWISTGRQLEEGQIF